MATTVMHTPPSSSQTRATHQLFRKTPSQPDSVMSSSPERPVYHFGTPSPSPLRRRIDFDDSPQSPSASLQPIALSYASSKLSQRSTSSSSSSSLQQSPTRPLTDRRIPSGDPKQQAVLPPVRPRRTSALQEIPSRLPLTRPAELSLSDLNAPQGKRRSVEFSQSNTMPRFVLTPPDAKPKLRPIHSRLAAPNFSTTTKPPLRRRASASPPITPSPSYEDWMTHITRHSDSMRKLSLAESHESGAPLFFTGSPLPSILSNLTDKKNKGGSLPSHLRHRKTRSGDAKAAKRLSLGNSRMPLDVFANSSSSPTSAVTPPDESPFFARIAQSDVHMSGDGIVDPDPPKPRSESLPDFVLPSERGIAQKRSNIGFASAIKPPKPRISRASEVQRSVVGDASFEAECEGGDLSFASMTSLGSPLRERGPSKDGGFPFDFLSGLDAPVDNLPQPTLSRIEPPMVTPGFGPSESSGWPNVMTNDSDDEGIIDISGASQMGVDSDIEMFKVLQEKHPVPASPPAKPMPDTPVKVPNKGIGFVRGWKSAIKSRTDSNRTSEKIRKAPRKSAPAAVGPFRNMNLLTTRSPDSDMSDFSSADNSDFSASPSLRPTANLFGFGPRKSYGAEIGLGRPASTSRLRPIALSNSTGPMLDLDLTSGSAGLLKKKVSSLKGGPDMITMAGVDPKKAAMMRRTSSGAWSVSSDESDGGFSRAGTPTHRGNPLSEWRYPTDSRARAPRKSVTFLEQSPLNPTRVTRHTSPSPSFSLSPRHGPLLFHDSPLRDLEMLSPPSSPRMHPSPHERAISPLPVSLFLDGQDEDDEDGSHVALEFGIREEASRFESQFVRVEPLGVGSFGQVYKVMAKPTHNVHQSLQLNRFYAIKKSQPFTGPADRLRRLEEFDILRHLSAMPTRRRSRSISLSSPMATMEEPPSINVLQFIHGWEQDRMLFIQTELCELGALSSFLLEWSTRFARLDESRLWKIMSEVGNGILHIHHQNIIHLDLKPDNILVTVEGRLRIADYGMASRWPRPASFTDPGTPHLDREGDRDYMAPEILSGQYGRAADIFSFGMIMLEAAGNIVPPSQGPEYVKFREGDFGEVDLSGLTPTLVNLIYQLLAPNPSTRPLIDQICAHDVLMKTRKIMLRNIRAARLASAQAMASAHPAELPVLKAEADMELYRASALGSEPSSFLGEIFATPADLSPSGSPDVADQSEPMDTTP